MGARPLPLSRPRRLPALGRESLAEHRIYRRIRSSSSGLGTSNLALSRSRYRRAAHSNSRPPLALCHLAHSDDRYPPSRSKRNRLDRRPAALLGKSRGTGPLDGCQAILRRVPARRPRPAPASKPGSRSGKGPRASNGRCANSPFGRTPRPGEAPETGSFALVPPSRAHRGRVKAARRPPAPRSPPRCGFRAGARDPRELALWSPWR